MDCNATKARVDMVDFMYSRIIISRRTNWWPMVIFFWLIGLAGINSLRIFQFNNPNIRKNTRRQYKISMVLMNEKLKGVK